MVAMQSNWVRGGAAAEGNGGEGVSHNSLRGTVADEAINTALGPTLFGCPA